VDSFWYGFYCKARGTSETLAPDWEPKDQGGELLDGGLFINAAPFEWSIKLTEGNQCLWPVTNAAIASLKTPCSRQSIQGRFNTISSNVMKFKIIWEMSASKGTLFNKFLSRTHVK